VCGTQRGQELTPVCSPARESSCASLV